MVMLLSACLKELIKRSLTVRLARRACELSHSDGLGRFDTNAVSVDPPLAGPALQYGGAPVVTSHDAYFLWAGVALEITGAFAHLLV